VNLVRIPTSLLLAIYVYTDKINLKRVKWKKLYVDAAKNISVLQRSFEAEVSRDGLTKGWFYQRMSVNCTLSYCSVSFQAAVSPTPSFNIHGDHASPYQESVSSYRGGCKTILFGYSDKEHTVIVVELSCVTREEG
jgi:hypothetical protein